MIKLTDYQIVPYSGEYLPGILRLMSNVPFKRCIWEWQFEKNPYGYEFKPIVVKLDDNVVGFNGVMAVHIFYKGIVCPAIWSCDFHVNAAHRGIGLGKIIKDNLVKKSEIIMAFGISNAAAHVLLKKGWNSSADVFVYKKYNKVNTFKKSICACVQQVNYIKGFARRLVGSASACEVTDALPGREQVEGLWERAGNSYKKLVIRNYDYLHWRYEGHPLVTYKFFCIYRNNLLKAIAVCREHDGYVRIVDMLAHAMDRRSRCAIVKVVNEKYSDASIINCTTSDQLLANCLLDHGYYKTREKPRFFVRTAVNGDVDAEKEWFIMEGDSDGEFVEAAADGFFGVESDKSIKVEEVNDAEIFREMEREWMVLLQQSPVNKLFLSWQWQYGWWESWAEELGLRLLLLKAYRGDELVGLAPLYLDTVQLRGGLTIRRLQFIGNAWRKKATVRTEYLEFILQQKGSASVASAFFKHISKMEIWDEFVICDLLPTSMTYRLLIHANKKYKWLPLEVSNDHGIKINTSGRFDRYIQMLGKNTRLRMFNRRKYLYGLGDINVKHATLDNVDEYFKELNSFHLKRWGKECFSGASLGFHMRLLKRLAYGQHFSFSSITLNGVPISSSYNLRIGDTVFNIQSGFEATLDNKLSMGTLHMGMVIENCFDDSDICTFDMLAGGGKTEFYKQKYMGELVEFVTIQVMRAHYLKILRNIHRVIPVKIKQLVSRMTAMLGARW